jgi:hypothetical protein
MRHPVPLQVDSRSPALPLRLRRMPLLATYGGDHNGAVRSIVSLPPGVRPPFDVYVNGVHQEEGVDYELVDGRLVFERELRKEGKLGFWRWFLGAWGVGTYRQNDSVDVRFELDGRPSLLEGLEIEPG